ncbi:MAG: hypothetical protein GY795_13520 [Desulfobacterales bacterium]|nr:hypothetical protein [Desulfobacterales bacterium]
MGINKNDFVNPDKDIENVIFELDIDNPVNAFLDCINQLKPPQKKIFILLELEKCSIDEIYQNYNVAEMIGKSSVSFESFEKYCKNIYQQLNDCIRGI